MALDVLAVLRCVQTNINRANDVARFVGMTRDARCGA
jgi:hypothetical protein